jgi:O-antigen ligase
MATRIGIFRRTPGEEGPLRTARRRLVDFVWGTDRRRTLTAVAVVLAAIAFYFLFRRGSPYGLFQLAILVGVFFTIMLKPHVGVIALKVYRAFARGLRVEYLVKNLGVTITKSIGLFTLVAFVALVVTKKIRPVFGHRNQLFFLYGLLLSTLISAFAALQWRSVGVTVFQMVQNVILYIIFVNLFAEAKWLSRFMWFTILALLASCFSGLASVALRGVIRAAGAMGNANGLAVVANHAAAMLLVLVLAESEFKKRFLFLAGLGLCLTTIIFTGSRGGLLTVIVTFAYQLIKRRKNLLPYMVAALILVGVFVAVPSQYKTRQEEWFGALFAGETEKVLGGARGFVYRSAWDTFKTSPFIGVGPRTFSAIYQEEYAGEARGPVARVRAVHSGLLEVLVGNGIVGFAVFAGLIVVTFLIFRANERRCRAAGLREYLLLNQVYEAWYVAVIVAGSFETILRGGHSFFVACAAAAVIHRASVLLAAEQTESALASAPAAAEGTAGRPAADAAPAA